MIVMFLNENGKLHKGGLVRIFVSGSMTGRQTERDKEIHNRNDKLR